MQRSDYTVVIVSEINNISHEEHALTVHLKSEHLDILEKNVENIVLSPEKG